MKQKFLIFLSQKTMSERVSWIMAVVLSFTVVVLAVLELTGLFANAINVAIPLLGIVMLLQAYNFRKISKISMTFSLIVAIFIIAVTALVWSGM